MKVLFGLNKKDMYNARNTAIKCEEIIDAVVKIEGIGIYEDNVENKETHEVERKEITCIKLSNGVIVASPSSTLRDSATSLFETFGEEEIKDLDIKIVYRKSNNGRKFLTIELV